MSEPARQVDSLLPAEDDVLSPDEQLAAIEDDLLAVPGQGDEFDLAVADELGEDPEPIGKGWAYDHQRRQFLRSSAGAAQTTLGMGTLRGWIDKAIRTERGAHPVNPDDYGMEEPFRLVGEPLQGAPVAEYEQDLVRCLTFHPRIADVTDFAVAEDDDAGRGALFLSFSVVLDDDTELSFDPFTLP